jgi:nucleoid-associated protein YgaU
MSHGNAEPEDPAADPRARFAPGAYAGPGQSGAPTAAESGKYVVQPNDNYWTVSEKVYGTGAFFKALHEHNRADHPKSDRLQVGDVLAVPPVALLHRQYPDLCPKPRHVRATNQAQMVAASPRQRMGAKVYVVEQGDTLFDIARYKLGKASRWAEIYELNRDTLGEDFDYLRPGTELVMPTNPEERGDSLTRQRDDSLQR